MSIDPAVQSRSYPATAPYQVGREAIRQFATAVKNTHSFHHDVDAARAAGHPDLVAPPTFLVSLAQRAEAAVIADPEVGIDFSRVLHADERFTHHRPVVAGDELVAAATIASVKALGGNSMITTKVDVTTVDGEEVATVASTLLVRAADIEEEQA